MKANPLPNPSPEFPAEWRDQFARELHTAAWARCAMFTRVLLALEITLLFFDGARLHWNLKGADALLVWRLAFVAFLGAYAAFAPRVSNVELRVKVFLAAGIGFCVWVSVLLSTISGDMAVFATGVLAMAALCPLPGAFGFATIGFWSVALGAALLTRGDSRAVFWLVNVVGSCVLGMFIDRICYRNLLNDFRNRMDRDRQRERLDELLYNVFPRTVAASLKDGKRSVASHSEVSILFADVVGFTSLASRLLPSQLVEVLENLFGRFDQLAARHGVEKIKTIGDAYMAICGAPDAIDKPVERIAGFALAMVAECERFGRESGFDLALRVGIHCGPVIAGVIGNSRLCYDLWGDSVNLAQRLEAHGERGVVCVSEPVYHRLRGAFMLEDRGVVELKGKGPTRMFVLVRAIEGAHAQPVLQP